MLAFEDLATSEEPHARALRLRAENLGVSNWQLWARGRPGSLIDDVERRDARCLVVDLGSLATREEQAVAAEAVLETLWRRRADREPVLVVIDEAHNVCPQKPDDLVTALVTEHAIRIAAEGRKFGLYLLVSTQRPQKVHENVLSQCDNLMVMRMNSLADLGFVADVFSFVPSSLLERATAFRQGEALVAGKIASHPSFVASVRAWPRRAGRTSPPTGPTDLDRASQRVLLVDRGHRQPGRHGRERGRRDGVEAGRAGEERGEQDRCKEQARHRDSACRRTDRNRERR